RRGRLTAVHGLFDLHGDGADQAPLLVIRLAGDPVGKERPRFRVVKPKRGPQFVHTFTSAKTRNYESALRAAAIDAMRGRQLLDGPLAILIFAYFKIPQSWPRRQVEAALAGDIRPTVKPDWENIGKTTDALNPYVDPKSKIKVPIVWRDDALVVDGRVVKIYAQRRPGIIVEIRRAGAPPTPWPDAT